MKRLLVAALLFTACAHVGTRGVQPDVRRVPFGTGELEVSASIPDVTATSVAAELKRKDIILSALWEVPGTDSTLTIIERPPDGDVYRPHHEGVRLYDDVLINPTFVRVRDRTLLLADHCSEC